jgi:hypothetical protein
MLTISVRARRSHRTVSVMASVLLLAGSCTVARCGATASTAAAAAAQALARADARMAAGAAEFASLRRE